MEREKAAKTTSAFHTQTHTHTHARIRTHTHTHTHAYIRTDTLVVEAVEGIIDGEDDRFDKVAHRVVAKQLVLQEPLVFLKRAATLSKQHADTDNI
jgi:hypothetical protein